MFLVAVAALSQMDSPQGEPIQPVTVWRNYDEVFDLATSDNVLYAATNGGLVRLEGASWHPLPSPSQLRSIDGVHPLTVTLSDTRVLSYEGGEWRPGPTPPPRVRDAYPGSGPPGYAYCQCSFRGGDYVGTSLGLFKWDTTGWIQQHLPSEIPVSRPNGLVEAEGSLYVGGLGGLYVGHPEHWIKISSEPVRQILSRRDGVWVLYGSGAVDKIEPSTERLYPDLAYGSARRPWASCLASLGQSLDFGGEGGWMERTGCLAENYPPDLGSDVVTAIAGRSGVRWIGTQASGLFEFSGSRVLRWNPGNGLTDVWVTALAYQPPEGLFVGTASGGLFNIKGTAIRQVQSPTRRVTRLADWRGRLVVGAMNGAWVREERGWRQLNTGGEETTGLSILGRRLAVVTASGVHFFGSTSAALSDR